MPTITVDQTDIDQARAFLTQLLTENFDDADFSEGSALQDHVIAPLSLIVAAMRGEAAKIRRASSLLTVAELETADERLAAVLGTAANWFVTPRPGNRVRGTLTLHFTEQRAGRIGTDAFFTKFSGIRFRLDQPTAYIYAATDLLPNVNARGEIEDFILRIPVIAEYTGNAYAVPAGPFASQASFSPYLLFVENETDFAPVTSPETAEELATRIPSTITNRDLTSPRSIDAVLREEFGFIDRLLVQGVASAAMKRDLVGVTPTFANIHVGGHTDIYVGAATDAYRTYAATVGEVFIDARRHVTLFTDDTVDDFRRFVREGAILRIYNAAGTEPTLYLIEEVAADFLRVARRQPFPSARPQALRNAAVFDTGTLSAPNQLRDVNADFTTQDIGNYIRIEGSSVGNDGDYRITAVTGDTVTLGNAVLLAEPQGAFTWRMFDQVVDYSVGDNATSYDNMVSRRTTGTFTRRWSKPGHVLLPQVPILLIREVELLNASDPDADPITGRVSFPNRRNDPPVAAAGDALSYQVVIDNPLEGGSDQQFATLRVGFAPEQQGSDGGLDLTGVFSAPSATFTVADVGKTLTLNRAFYLTNRGEFTVAEVLSPTRVRLTNPRAGSWMSRAEKRLEWELADTARFDGYTLRVVYDTVANFGTVASYAQDVNQRVAAADTLIKSFHPVYVGFELKYTVRPIASSNPSEDRLKQTLVDFINAFPVDDVLDVSDIVTAFQNAGSDTIGSVLLPLSLTYTLYAPDGRAIPYSTTDSVRIDDAKNSAITDSERLLHPADISVTDATVRYLSDPSLITLTLVS